MVLPAATIFAVTLVAAVHPRLQGVLITGTGLVGFVAAMILMPLLKRENQRSVRETAVPKLPQRHIYGRPIIS